MLQLRILFLVCCLLPQPLLAQAPKLVPPVVLKETPVDPKGVPPDLADWTPRPATGKAEPWEKMRDPDWQDARFRSMNTGPTQNATFRIPNGLSTELVYKGTAVRTGDGGALFDRCTMRWAGGWFNGFLQHSDRRYGLKNTPTPPTTARMIFSSRSTPGWLDPTGKMPPIATATAPLPATEAQYLGHYVHGDRVVMSYRIQGVRILDAMKPLNKDGKAAFLRTVQIDPHEKPLTMKVDDNRNAIYPPSKKAEAFFTKYGDAIAGEADDLDKLVKPGAARWGRPIITKLVRGDETGPFATDTLTIPYENRFKALFFCTGLDFLPDGRIAMCTCHGDVWLVEIDEKANTVAWQRHATGLYHPLGLKVVEGKVVVLERGQLTRLHDSNADGEADFYECISNNWHTGSDEHAYDTCLETDIEGNYYFFKTGDSGLPSGGCLLRVSADGKKVETVATGFRHPIGMGFNAERGIITGADQEGNWMPATRIDQYKPGGFYGDMRAHHRAIPPKTYDPPVCWLPREVDNSAGGQVWIPESAKAWGALAGLPLHLSYGRCKAFVLLRQEIGDGVVQGGVADLGLRFLSGSCRGRFHTKDQALYVCGLNGWQTSAKADGSLQRVRATGKTWNVPIKLEAVVGGVKLTFPEALEAKSVEDAANYRSAYWNYRWSKEYGSKRWKVSNPNAEGQEDVAISGATLIDEKTVFVKIPTMQPVMQMQLGYNLQSKTGSPVVGSVYFTVHGLGK